MPVGLTYGYHCSASSGRAMSLQSLEVSCALFLAMYVDCVDLFCFGQLFRLSGRAAGTPGYAYKCDAFQACLIVALL